MSEKVAVVVTSLQLQQQHHSQYPDQKRMKSHLEIVAGYYFPMPVFHTEQPIAMSGTL